MAKRIVSKAFPQGTSVSPRGISDDILYSTVSFISLLFAPITL
jgi:hypothetical protein